MAPRGGRPGRRVGPGPNERDVAAAAAVETKAADVDTVQTRLALAERQLEQTEIAAAQAVEAFNAARYRAQQAGQAARAAQQAADAAASDLSSQRDACTPTRSTRRTASARA